MTDKTDFEAEVLTIAHRTATTYQRGTAFIGTTYKFTDHSMLDFANRIRQHVEKKLLERTEELNNKVEFLDALLCADNALIAGLKNDALELQAENTRIKEELTYEKDVVSNLRGRLAEANEELAETRQQEDGE